MMATYYDEHGELVYRHTEESNNGTWSEESFYIHGRKLIDVAWKCDCGCCDDDDMTEFDTKTKSVLPVTLSETLAHGLYLKNFLHADTLLAILKSEKYYDDMEYDNSIQ